MLVAFTELGAAQVCPERGGPLPLPVSLSILLLPAYPFMPTLLAAKLRRILLRLQSQNRTYYSSLDRHYLVRTLSATITDLFHRYPDKLSSPQQQLLQQLILLEQEVRSWPPTAHEELTTWQALHHALQMHVQAAFSSESDEFNLLTPSLTAHSKDFPL